MTEATRPALRRALSGSLLIALFLTAGCSGEVELGITNQSLKQETAKIAGLPKELASLGSPASGYNYWVEGMIENKGPDDARDVVIVFEADDGANTLTLIADVGMIPSGKTVRFQTRSLSSLSQIKLLDNRTDIRYR